MMSPTSPSFAENAQVLSALLLPMPGIESVLPNHCVSLEPILSVASAVKSAAFAGLVCRSRAEIAVIASRACCFACSSAI